MPAIAHDGEIIELTEEEFAATCEAPEFGMLQATKDAAVRARIEVELARGAPIEVAPDVFLHVALDDGTRADVTGMAATALAAASSAVPWPESYQLGFIAIENVRIPLPTPVEGLGLAALVGDRYAKIRQNGRDLKDAVAAAVDEAALDAVDIDSGWPE
jgi:hypothetical protein